MMLILSLSSFDIFPISSLCAPSGLAGFFHYRAFARKILCKGPDYYYYASEERRRDFRDYRMIFQKYFGAPLRRTFDFGLFR